MKSDKELEKKMNNQREIWLEGFNECKKQKDDEIDDLCEEVNSLSRQLAEKDKETQIWKDKYYLGQKVFCDFQDKQEIHNQQSKVILGENSKCSDRALITADIESEGCASKRKDGSGTKTLDKVEETETTIKKEETETFTPKSIHTEPEEKLKENFNESLDFSTITSGSSNLKGEVGK